MSKKSKKPGRKAVVKVECVERLKNGATMAELLREYKPGPVYDAVREFLNSQEGEVKEVRKARSWEEEELARVRNEGKQVGLLTAKMKADYALLDVNVKLLEKRKKEFEVQVSELKREEDRLKSKSEEYKLKGVTDKSFKRLDAINFGSGDELLPRIDSVERYNALVSELTLKESELKGRNDQVLKLRKEMRKLVDEITSTRNIRDQELKKNYVQSESIKILSGFFREGYNSDDIEGIRIGLNTLKIEGDPKISVKRLVEALSGELQISKLKTEILAKTDQLQVLNTSVETVKGQLESYQDDLLAALTNAENISRKHLDNMYLEAEKKFEIFNKTTEEHLEKLSASNIAAIDNAGKAGIGNLINIHEEAKNKIDETVDTVRNDVKDTIRNELKPYSELLGIIPQMKFFTSYGYFLMRVPMDRNVANMVPMMFVSMMSISIDEWIKVMMPEATITAPNADMEILTVFHNLKYKRLTELSSWLRQELAKKTFPH